MKKISKKAYFTPETEIIRFQAQDIITTSDISEPSIGDGNKLAGDPFISNDPFSGS